MFDQRIDERRQRRRAGRLEAQCACSYAARRVIQAFERRAIGRQRPAAVGRHPGDQPLQRHVEPDRDPVAVDHRPVLRIDERAAAGRDHEVTRAELLQRARRVRRARKYGSPCLREDLGDRHRAPAVRSARRCRPPASRAACQRARHRRLARGHEADEIHLVRFHARRAGSSVSKKPDTRWRRRRRRRSCDGPRGRQRRDRERHRHPVIAVRVGHAAGRRARRPRTTKPSGALVGVDAERAEPGDQRRDAIAFLDAQLRRAADRHLAAVRRQRGDRRQFVDEAGHFVGRDLDACRCGRLRR